MSSGAALQLFPPPPSQTKPLKPKPSARKAKKIKKEKKEKKSEKTEKSAGEVVEHTAIKATFSGPPKPINVTKKIVLHVSDALSPISPVSVKEQKRAATPTPSSRPDTPIAELPAVGSRSNSPALTHAGSTVSHGTTLVRSSSNASSKKQPLTPMNSLFPRYNQNVPLSRQDYHPTYSSPTHVSRDAISKQPYSPGSYTAHSAGKAVPHSPGDVGGAPRTAPPACTSFPPNVLGNSEPRFSAQEELVDLWEAANGQVTPERGRMFALRMSRNGTPDATSHTFVPTPSESFRFDCADPFQTFYDFVALKAHDHSNTFSELHLQRHDPIKGTSISVMTMQLEDPSRRSPPNDGLITSIFPSLAKMMALDKARSPASSTSDPEKLAAEALERAAARECCSLSFDPDSGRYYLIHPGLSQRFVMLIEGVAGLDVPDASGVIRIVDPESGSSLVALEFGARSLIVDTRATSSIKSLYAVDFAVSAVLVVALVEGRRLRAQGVARGVSPLPAAMLSPLPASAVPEIGAPPVTSEVDEKPRSIGGAPELPQATEGLLGMLAVAFQFIVWVLGAIFGALAAAVVTVSALFSRQDSPPASRPQPSAV